MKNTLLKGLLAGAALLVLLSGCVQVFEDEKKEETTMTPGDTVKIGVLLPLSGEGAAYGLPAQRVIQIAAESINASGGIKGKKVELVFEDGACDSEPANRATTTLVELRKVKVIIGGFCSSETLAAAPIVEKNKVVLLSPASSNPSISQAGDFVFRNYPSDAAQGQALADYAKSKGYKKVGILVEEQPFTEGIADAFSTTFTGLGGEVMLEKFAKDASDFKTQITKLQAAKVDIFFVNPQAPAKAGLIVKQLKEASVKGPFILNDVALGAKKEIIEPYKEYVEGSVGAEVPYDKNHADFPKLQEAYKKMSNGEEVPYMSYMGPAYDSLFIIKEALEQVGEDSVKIKDYLYTVKGRKGLAGTLSFDQNGDPDKSYRHTLRVLKNGVAEEQ